MPRRRLHGTRGKGGGFLGLIKPLHGRCPEEDCVAQRGGGGGHSTSTSHDQGRGGRGMQQQAQGSIAEAGTASSRGHLQQLSFEGMSMNTPMNTTKIQEACMCLMVPWAG